jgi:hypothetical protein
MVIDAKKTQDRISKRGRINEGRPLKFKSPEEIKVIADAYFKKCDEDKKPYTITGLALALDTFRDVLIRYEEKDQFYNTIKKAKEKCQNYAELQGFEAKNPAFAIFCLKNYGWSDKQELEVSGDLTLSARLKESRERLKP